MSSTVIRFGGIFEIPLFYWHCNWLLLPSNIQQNKLLQPPKLVKNTNIQFMAE